MNVSVYHEPVLFKEVMEALAAPVGACVFDGTLGGGGHTEGFLKSGLRVWSMDQDEDALQFASERLVEYADQWQVIKGNFRDMDRLLSERQAPLFDRILIDIGVSSFQLDEAGRGFSLMRDGPLDMRMDQKNGVSAADIVNHWAEEALCKLFKDYGEEPSAWRIAKLIVEKRRSIKFESTLQLADFILNELGRRGKKHPATLIFQALRIAVNDELGALDQFLKDSPKWLKRGGRLGVITFHSLEDRMVKRIFQHWSTEWLDQPEWPEPRRNPEYGMKLISRKGWEASETELKMNPRARSARLRVVEKIKGGEGHL
jgi:16S rRNA (cytosine1402-N4)-methyltransferase